MKKENFNKKHPELKGNEVFLANLTLGDYVAVSWVSKRHGNLAYNFYGEKLGEFPKIFPVFINISDIKNTKNAEDLLKEFLLHATEVSSLN